jgi:SRSO17 transposase
VFLAYASRHGHALTGRELCLPRFWTGDPARCRAAGIPPDTGFATKPARAQAMIARAAQAGVPFAWFTADEAYGQANWLKAWLQEQGVFYVMAIRCNDTVTTSTGEQRG